MSAAPDPITQQYHIEVGPFTQGNAHHFVPLTPLQSNCSFIKRFLHQDGNPANDALPVGLMFSKGGFLTNSMQTPQTYTMHGTEPGTSEEYTPGKSLFLVNLVPLRVVQVLNDNLREAYALRESDCALSPPGTAFYLRWGKKFILDDEKDFVLIRVVEHNPEPPDDIVPLYRHGRDPIVPLNAHLLARLKALAAA